MSDYTDVDIQRALNSITSKYRRHPELVCVEYTHSSRFICRFSDLRVLKGAIHDTVELRSTRLGTVSFVDIEFVEGPTISTMIGNVHLDPPLETRVPLFLDGEMGGDQCRNANNMDYYGTITAYVRSIGYSAHNSSCQQDCSADNALVCCNHVIGRDDAGRPGEVIWTPFRSDTAHLSCVLPLRCSDIDLAMATATDMTGIQRWTVRQIGLLADNRIPNIGEAIQKYGVRTGYTTGSVWSKTNINAGGHYFNGVYATTVGFGCPGDSGSAVVSNNGANSLLGVLSWVDTMPCANAPRGYFYSLTDHPAFDDLSSSKSNTVAIEQGA
ncbi:MAG TPA: trypsin-like serine protease [Steroidobacteraceae bacterium]|jgi:hypothetical protein